MSFACCKSVDTLKDPAEDRKETISSHGLEITAEDKVSERLIEDTS